MYKLDIKITEMKHNKHISGVHTWILYGIYVFMFVWQYTVIHL
jgi:hypothetical protein